jgi:hypothetical protein
MPSAIADHHGTDVPNGEKRGNVGRFSCFQIDGF